MIEDDIVLRKAFARALRAWSAEVTEAWSVSSAREELKEQPDMVVLDIGLPDGSGVELAKEMSNMVPVPMSMVVSGEANAPEAFRLKEYGVLSYLSKPLSLEDLTIAMDKLLQTPPDLEPQLRSYVGKKSFRDVQRAVRKSMLEQALGMSDGNMTRAGKLLNVSRQAVQQMIRDFKLSRYFDAIQDDENQDDENQNDHQSNNNEEEEQS